MQSLSKAIDAFLAELGADYRKVARAARNHQLYKNAVINIWRSQGASDLILGKTNAFYVRRDETVRLKGSCREGEGDLRDKGYIVCEVYVEDAIVLSELDTHKEILAFALRSNGLSFDEMRLLHSKGNMRKNHPFIEAPSR